MAQPRHNRAGWGVRHQPTSPVRPHDIDSAAEPDDQATQERSQDLNSSRSAGPSTGRFRTRRQIIRLKCSTTRNPLLLFRLSGAFLLRFAERQFLGLLFQEPRHSPMSLVVRA